MMHYYFEVHNSGYYDKKQLNAILTGNKRRFKSCNLISSTNQLPSEINCLNREGFY